MDNEQTEVLETGTEGVVETSETSEETTGSVVKLTAEEKLARLEGGAKRLRKSLGLPDIYSKKEETKKEEVKEPKKSDNGLLEKTYLRSAGITEGDEVEFALETAKKWNVDIDKLVDDPDFQLKLERLRTSKANVKATANLRGGSGSSEVKNSPDFYLSRGTPPSKDEVPDRKTRAKIARAFVASSKNTKKFYND